MSVENFMNDFLAAPIEKIDEEYILIEKQYKEKFGHIVPREMIPPNIPSDRLKIAMQECLKTGEDNILEQLGIEINSEYLY